MIDAVILCSTHMLERAARSSMWVEHNISLGNVFMRRLQNTNGFLFLSCFFILMFFKFLFHHFYIYDF